MFEQIIRFLLEFDNNISKFQELFSCITSLS